ncbi:MAG TPA: NADH-quinone oxidoreductase subunit L [Candidatus Binataceae bacterium]|nr:NADH-quinone oxidoreductase subunit L [Candidatus Binataceae bacterium]
MTQEFPALGAILLFPALGVLYNLFLGRSASRSAVNFMAPAAIGVAFLASLYAFATLWSMPAGSALTLTLWPWISAGPFHVDLALRFDALTAVMALVVSGVGTLIHIYSAGYMAHEADYARYFTYLNLFTFSMLVLVLADNLLLMFVGWEGVGLCSYLLIAFWYENPEYAYNGRKAFIVNRIGDAGFLLGLFTIVAALGSHGVWTLTFAGLREHAAMLQPVALAAGLLLFLGATGKSAQIPLYVWLPDAMVGPTPVSALIHAATMVTAGVYMIARLGFMFVLAPDALMVVAVVGTVTSFFAATIALVQSDIKRVLAYSTVSQIGYMMLGVGTGAFASGIFHLMTHAFFKALLFLGAGSVIHALDGEQDMSKMGGLRTKLPKTWITMLVATLAISGVPPLAGFFSKDLILESAYRAGYYWLWLLGLITAGMTSFYMFRLLFLTFYGESRLSPENEHHCHESPAVMTIPLMILAVFSVIAGWLGLPEGIGWGDAFARFLEPIVGTPHFAGDAPAAMLSGLATIVALAGIALAYVFYLRLPGLPMLLSFKLQAFYTTLSKKYYVDEVYNELISRPLFWISTYVLHRGVDVGVIDGIVNGSGLAVETSGEGLRHSETGNVQHYAFVYLLGAVAIVAYYVYRVMA